MLCPSEQGSGQKLFKRLSADNKLKVRLSARKETISVS